MSKLASSLSGAAHDLLCSRCYKRESCIKCCGTLFCLRHFHTSKHATDHPNKASVLNQQVLDKQLPAFEEMWREAFQSVADDVDRLSREVENRVAEDPLGSIAMARPEKPSPSKGKGPQKSVGASSLTSSKRQRKYEEERAAAVDPFARRRTRPKSYWSVGQEPESTAELDKSSAEQAAAIAAAAPRVGEYQCESCCSEDTSFDIIGGAAVGTRKAETFGKKDAPELILRVVCHACGNNWLEER